MRAPMRNRALALLGAVALTAAVALVAPPRSWADGAVAVGTTGNVVSDGIAFGMVVNEPKEQASEMAIQRCRTFQARSAAERCKVVATFSGQCFAVAYDPQPGTPGAGWGVGPDQLAANRKAIAMCEETAGPARKGYCQVESGACDTMGPRGAVQPGPQGPVTAEAKPALEASTTEPRVPPRSPALEAPSAPAPKEPAKMEQKKERASRFGTSSPALFIGAMVTVGAAYALGQIARGRLQGGFGERQFVVGGGLVIVSGVIVKLLGMAGLEQTALMVVAGIIALAAAFLA
jgi:multisubunit Na+/H+ antiporter MnhB subunit